MKKLVYGLLMLMLCAGILFYQTDTEKEQDYITNDIKVSALGFNGGGTIKVEGTKQHRLDDYIISVKTTKNNLSNGDSIKIELKDKEDPNKRYLINYQIKGLDNILTLKDWKEIQSKITEDKQPVHIYINNEADKEVYLIDNLGNTEIVFTNQIVITTSEDEIPNEAYLLRSNPKTKKVELSALNGTPEKISISKEQFLNYTQLK